VADEVSDWDFFVSYTQADRLWAEWIAWILEENGYRVLVQAWDFVAGTNWTQHMQDGTAHAARTIAVLSNDYLKSVYGKPEWLAAWQQDPDGAQRKLIPIRVAECDRPGLLAAVVGFDLFGCDQAQARARLLEGAAGATSGRAKPTSKPGFPGAGRAVSTAARFPGTLPSTWRVPARNPNFTGRNDELTEMKTSLTADSTVTVHSVSGLGGVGKTRLAIEYAHKFASDYDVVWWIAAETPATIPDHFAALATNLGLEPADGPDELRAAVHDALRTVGGWLLIFDNADSVEDIEPWVPSGPVSAGTPGHVIVTTRRRGFRRLGTVLDLDVIDMGAAVRLLQTRTPDLDNAIAESIAEVLGRLPLGLEQAAAYLDRTQIPAREYLDLLTTRQSTLLTGIAGQLRDRSVATVWELSLDRIRDDDPAGLQLLDICAYLAPEPIPLDLFISHPDELPHPLSTAAADPLLFNNAIATVVGVIARAATDVVVSTIQNVGPEPRGIAITNNGDANDVDDGVTTLLSPTIDLSGAVDPVLSYRRWYSNDQGADPGSDTLLIQVSSDAGQSWSELDSTAGSTGGWQQRQIHLAEFTSITSGMRIQFLAMDQNGSPSIVEAAIDDLEIVGPSAGCTGCLPTAPVGTIYVNRSGDDVVLSWTADPVSAPRYVAYRVAGPAYDQPVRIGSTSGRSFTHENAALLPEAIFYFVSAVNACGQESTIDTEP